MTKKLFYTNPDIMEWTTKITSSKYENGKWVITLQETAFYPEGGGQPCDTGKIAGIPVENVYKDHDEVYHILPMKPEQEEVSCAIDAKRRLVHTQHHSGQHLLSATCLDLYGFETLSFHLSDETATIDLDVEALTEEELIMIESEVNRRIFANIPVRTFYIDSSLSIHGMQKNMLCEKYRKATKNYVLLKLRASSTTLAPVRMFGPRHKSDH